MIRPCLRCSSPAEDSDYCDACEDAYVRGEWIASREEGLWRRRESVLRYERDAARAELATLRGRIEALRFQGGLADPSTLAWALRVLDGQEVVRPPCHTCDGAGCQEPAPGSACTWRAARKEVPR